MYGASCAGRQATDPGGRPLPAWAGGPGQEGRHRGPTVPGGTRLLIYGESRGAWWARYGRPPRAGGSILARRSDGLGGFDFWATCWQRKDQLLYNVVPSLIISKVRTKEKFECTLSVC